MKWFLLVAVIGVAEIVTIGELRVLVGTNKLVFLYLITTAIGASLLYIRLSKFKESFHATRKSSKYLHRKWKKAHLDENTFLTRSEIMKLEPSIFLTYFMMAVLLIAVPGILSDIIGTILAIPLVSDFMVKRELKSLHIKYAYIP